MGSGASKPVDASKHVFSSNTPIQFSQELVDSMQASSESNSTRAKTLELHIAERVAAELEKIQKRETEKFEAIRAELSNEAPDPEPSPSDSQSTTSRVKEVTASLVPDSLTPSGTIRAKEEKSRKEQTSKRVQEEIEKLKKQLSERKVLKDLTPGVQKARNSVVSCLRVNDRTPLDCWKEVEAFKLEVRKMEDKFVGEVL